MNWIERERTTTVPHTTGKVAAACLLVGLLSIHCQTTESQSATTKMEKEVIKQAPEGSWTSVSGEVVATDEDSFTLDYGTGVIDVEMSDWSWIPDSGELMLHDSVVVYGHIDDGFFDERSIEATSVYVYDLQTYFFADEGDEAIYPTITEPDLDPSLELRGTIQAVSGSEFELETLGGTLTVDTEEMLYNPLDNEGYQQLDVGDTVRVVGELEEQLFRDRELVADVILTIREAPEPS